MAGNANSGRRKEKLWRDALWLEGNRLDELTGEKQIARAARVLFQKAMEGDVPALKEIGDRLDGKPAQEQDININETKTVIRAPNVSSNSVDWLKEYSAAKRIDGKTVQ